MSRQTPRPKAVDGTPTPAMAAGELLLAGDWHGNAGHARWTIDEAVRRGVDRIFQLGDFGFWEHQPMGVRFLDDVESYASSHGVTIYFLDGNHDKTSLLLATYGERDADGFVIVRPHVRYAPRGHRWAWGAVTFIALGGAYSVDKAWRLAREDVTGEPESFWFPEEEMSDEDLTAFLADESPVDVLLSHDKPRETTPFRNRKNSPDCFPNQDRISRAAAALTPRLLAHGHLHFRYTAQIRLTHDTWCTVEGVDADPTAALGERAGSVLVLPLDTAPPRPEAP